jgi:RimJ/RimL family protein N-acetyltransferase
MITRYRPMLKMDRYTGADEADMTVDPSGDYVRHSDYMSLLSEKAVLAAEVEDLNLRLNDEEATLKWTTKIQADTIATMELTMAELRKQLSASTAALKMFVWPFQEKDQHNDTERQVIGRAVLEGKGK